MNVIVHVHVYMHNHVLVHVQTCILYVYVLHTCSFMLLPYNVALSPVWTRNSMPKSMSHHRQIHNVDTPYLCSLGFNSFSNCFMRRRCFSFTADTLYLEVVWKYLCMYMYMNYTVRHDGMKMRKATPTLSIAVRIIFACGKVQKMFGQSFYNNAYFRTLRDRRHSILLLLPKRVLNI